MKTQLPLILAVACSVIGSASAEDEREQHTKEARQLLEFSQRTGTLPEGVAIRVVAQLSGHLDNGRRGEERTFKEAWEFTSKEVHRIVGRCEDQKFVYRRTDSRPFDSIVLCKELMDGKVFEIEERKAKGDEIMFAGTDFNMGLRSIEILRNGEAILEVYECCALAGFRGEDAIAFAALYERLAAHARETYKSLETAREPEEAE